METYITRDGKIYRQILSEVEVDVAKEEYKLQAWKDALVSDAREQAEYEAKIAEIDALKIEDEYKQKLKETVPFYSGSGIKPEMVAEQEATVSSIVSAVIDVIK